MHVLELFSIAPANEPMSDDAEEEDVRNPSYFLDFSLFTLVFRLENLPQ